MPSVVIAGLWTLLLTDVLAGTWVSRRWISSPWVLLIWCSHGARSVDEDRVTVEEHDVVLRPDRVVDRCPVRRTVLAQRRTAPTGLAQRHTAPERAAREGSARERAGSGR